MKNQQIVYAGNDWNADNKTSSHHIAQRLSAHNTLLYIEAAGQRAPRVSKRDLGRIFQRILKAFKNPQKVQNNVYVWAPLIIPFHRYSLVRKINNLLLRFSLRRACKTLGFENPLIWLAVPHYASIVDSIPCKGVVYYCVDEFASLPNADSGGLIALENHLLSRADVVFAVSEKLWESKKRLNPNTHLSPHGVDTLHFGKASKTETEIPADIARIRKPIAGFFGLVEQWFDINLITYLASNLPDISFVIIGRISQNVAGAKALPNVHFLGQKPYGLIPNYLKAFDLGLIPFKLNDAIIHSNPLKFKEYLAGGKPVVSVRIGAIEKFKDVAYFADSYEEFAKQITRAIREDSQANIEARISAMEHESWDSKFDQVCSIVQDHIPVARTRENPTAQ